MIFVDSDAFIALYSKDDLHHQKAKKILSYLKKIKEDLITSWDVVDETTTKLSYKATKKISVAFFKGILKSEIIIFYPDMKIAKKAFEIFRKQKSKRVSLTDSTNMAIAKQKEIKTFFSFDRHYEENGFALLRAKN